MVRRVAWTWSTGFTTGNFQVATREASAVPVFGADLYNRTDRVFPRKVDRTDLLLVQCGVQLVLAVFDQTDPAGAVSQGVADVLGK